MKKDAESLNIPMGQTEVLSILVVHHALPP